MPTMVPERRQGYPFAGSALTRLAAALPALHLSLAACTAEAPTPGTDKVEVPTVAGSAASTAATVPARRCGWLHNPTPGNWWLVDRDGEWILGTQGGYQAPGLDEMPDMTRLGWVEVNGHYGHGCACMTLGVDAATRRVTRIDSAAPQPLKQCRADPGLPRP